MKEPRTEKLSLIDRDRLVRDVEYQAGIGGEERLLSKREVISLIYDSYVWEEKQIKVF